MADLTPQIAADLMQRSMTTGIPTFEFQQYGGYDAVKNAYERAGGGYNPAQATQLTSIPAATTVAPPPASGIAALPLTTPTYDPTKITDVGSLYQQVLGRDPTKTGDTGFEWWQKEIGAGGISPEEYQKFVAAAKPELDVQKLYTQYLGRGADPQGLEYWKNKIAAEGITPEEQNLFYKTAIPEIVSSAYRDVLGRGIGATDPGRAYWTEQLGSGTLKPEDFISNLIQGASGADILPAQQYSILGGPTSLADFELFSPLIERNLGMTAGSLSTPSQNLANKSLQEIKNILNTSGANRYQEANRIAGIAKQVYGYTDDQAKQLGINLIKGTESNQVFKDYYDSLVQGKPIEEAQQKLLQDAVQKNPNSQFFKDNPNLKQIYTPIAKLESRPEGSNQYGLEQNTKLPYLSLEAAQNVLGGNVSTGGRQEFRKDIGQDKLGFDPHSAWAGKLATGVGIYGVDATAKEIKDFDEMQKEFNSLGGIKTEYSPEGERRDVIYKDQFDPESNTVVKRAFQVQDFFPMDDYTGTVKYDRYVDTQNKLREAAKFLGIDYNQYSGMKEAYDDLNKRLEGKWLIQGRTNTLDPAAAKALGIDDVTDEKKHFTALGQTIGDKIVPTKVVRTFDFQDPNTTSGFLGDIIHGFGQILSIPPIQIAFMMAGGWPALFEGTLGTELAATAATDMAQRLGENILSSFTNDTSLIAQYAPYVGRVALNAGTSGLNTGLMTGDLNKAGIAALSGAIGTGISGGIPTLLKDYDISPSALKIGSEILGGSAATAITGQDPGQYAINRLLGTGLAELSKLAANQAGISTKGPSADLVKAMMPIVVNRRVNPEDVTRLAAAVRAYQAQKA